MRSVSNRLRSFALCLTVASVVFAGAPSFAANALYGKYRASLVSWSDAGLSAAIDLKTDTIKAVLVTSGYTPALTTHQFLSSVGANTLGTAQTLTWTSGTLGVYKASNPTFTSVPAGTVTYVAIYKDTGSSATSPLIALIDTATGIPVTSTGSMFNITITWDATNGIFVP